MASFDGAKLTLRGQEFTVLPLTLGAIRRLDESGAMEVIASDKPLKEKMPAMCEVVYLALKPTNPDLNREQVEDLLDLLNVHEAIKVIFTGSGLAKRNDSNPEAGSP